MQRHKLRKSPFYARIRGNGGFGLLDTLLAVSLMSVAFGFVVGVAVELKRTADLDGAALTLLERFRFAQALGVTTSEAGMVWLDPYDTRYHLTHEFRPIGWYAFPSDVNYVDGYLQLENHRISYDNLGDAQVAGKVRLTTGAVERDIKLYMGTGLQVAGWITP